MAHSNNTSRRTITCGAWLILLLFPIAGSVWAQDTTKVERPVVMDQGGVTIEAEDTIAMRSYAARFNPRKALLYAAAVPGLGQIYNKKYWKLPLVYGGFAAIGWNISRFNDIYVDYRSMLFGNLEAGFAEDTDFNPDNGFTTGQLRRIVQRAQRERDFWIIMVGAMYILQVVDAHVDAHLKEFDLNPNLRVSVQPTFGNDSLLGRQHGGSVIIKF